MNDFLMEPYLHLADVTPDAALISWGGFYFRPTPQDPAATTAIIEDHELARVDPDRRETIGAHSPPYGTGQVEIRVCGGVRAGEIVARATTEETNHVWVTGLEPDTEYEYRLLVDGERWADGVRRDWIADDGRYGLRPSGRGYRNRFRTHPAADAAEPLTFAVLGDFGVGVRDPDGAGAGQAAVARALEQAVDRYDVRLIITTGDNVYLGTSDTRGQTGAEDDDWFFTFYQPYRYLINRIPVYPAVGNHDTSDTERSDDRRQLDENFYLRQRFASAAGARRASLDPGLFYRFFYGSDIEFVSIDTTRASELTEEHYVDSPRHREFLREAFPEPGAAGARPWRIPFSHHPPYCAGPSHHNNEALIERLCPLLDRSGARVMFSGHEHNFQHSRVAGTDYVISGAGGKLREEAPQRFAEAHTRAWAAETHLLVVQVGPEQMVVHPLRGLRDGEDLVDLPLRDPEGRPVRTPLVFER